MSAQRLSDRSIRRIERDTGLNIVRAWSHGGYVMGFVIVEPNHPAGHRHGWWHKATRDWAVLSREDNVMHYTSCREFEGYP